MVEGTQRGGGALAHGDHDLLVGHRGRITGREHARHVGVAAVVDHDLAALHATQRVKVRQQRFIVGALPPQMVQQKPSGLCRNDPLAAPFEKGQAELCFALTREALTNAVRHAPALSQVQVSWDHGESAVTVTVHKPHAPVGVVVDDVAVTIRRRR